MNLRDLVLTAAVTVALVGGAGCGTPSRNPGIPGTAPDTRTAIASGPGADRLRPVSPVTGEAAARPAPVPLDLSQVQDPQERQQEYRQLTQQMIGDLEDEVRWQEKLETLAASATSGGKP